MNLRETIKDKKRIVIKVGSSSLTHKETGKPDLIRIEHLVRELSDLRNQGKDVVLVSSGAIAVGKSALGYGELKTDEEKQAFAAIGQSRLIMLYQRLFSEYGQTAAQILLTKNNMTDNENRHHARNTFRELFALKAIPVVNENDTVTTYEIQFGDNDTLSAIVSALVGADLLILLSDIDGLYSDDPRNNPEARFIPLVENLDENTVHMAKGSTGSSVGKGGMATKIEAAEIATAAGCDMIIARADDFRVIHHIMAGEEIGTLFKANSKDEFYLLEYLNKIK